MCNHGIFAISGRAGKKAFVFNSAVGMERPFGKFCPTKKAKVCSHKIQTNKWV